MMDSSLSVFGPTGCEGLFCLRSIQIIVRGWRAYGGKSPLSECVFVSLNWDRLRDKTWQEQQLYMETPEAGRAAAMATNQSVTLHNW